jgi:transcriptional regulator with XRE-family HTH domain
MQAMSGINLHPLEALGERLRQMRIARNETQQRFCARLGVSVPTLRRMERGDPAVQVGLWVRALEVLGRAADLDLLLAERQTLFDQAEAKPRRQRVRTRP